MKKITKASKRRLAVFGLLSVAIMGYFLISTATNFIKIMNFKEEYSRLNNKLNDLQEEEKILKTDIIKLQDPDYLARYARENYSYSKDGEIIIRIDEDETISKIEEKNMDYQKYIIYSLTIILVIILIIIFKPKKSIRRK